MRKDLHDVMAEELARLGVGPADIDGRGRHIIQAISPVLANMLSATKTLDAAMGTSTGLRVSAAVLRTYARLCEEEAGPVVNIHITADTWAATDALDRNLSHLAEGRS